MKHERSFDGTSAVKERATRLFDELPEEVVAELLEDTVELKKAIASESNAFRYLTGKRM